MGDFRMPALGAEMTEGKLVEWLVQPGATVHRGEVIAVVETDKAALEVEVWEDGTVGELLVEEGAKVPVGTLLATIEGVGAAPTPEPAPGAAPAAAEAPLEIPAAEEPAAEEPAAEEAPVERERIPVVHGPIARHRAEELGVDLSHLVGTGPGGSITRRDVEEAGRELVGVAVPAGNGERTRSSPYARRLAAERGLDLSTLVASGPGGSVVARDVAEGGPAGPREPTGAAPVAAPSPPERPSGGDGARAGDAMRLAIARAMARSKREIPHYYLDAWVDLTPALSWLEVHNAERPAAERVLPAALQLRAVALALREHPELNGYWIDDAFRPSETIDIGVAIALRGGGLIAPAIHRTDTLELDALMAKLRDLVRRTRAGRLRSSEATDGTITVTNLGDLGVESVFGVIYPPQVALVGFGRPVERPWAVDGMLGVRTVVHLTLAADHRQTDGAVGGRFLTTIAGLLERPEDL